MRVYQLWLSVTPLNLRKQQQQLNLCKQLSRTGVVAVVQSFIIIKERKVFFFFFYIYQLFWRHILTKVPAYWLGKTRTGNILSDLCSLLLAWIMAFEFALFSCFSSPSPSPALLKDFVFYKSVSLALESWISSPICARHFVPLKLHFYISSQWSYICRLLLTFTLIKLNPFIIPLSYKELWRWGAQKNGCKRLNCLGKITRRKGNTGCPDL